jgi:beta-lactamase regulating signal transducer with metallopeptidase domain
MMLDLSAKWAIAAGLVWLVTRRTPPVHAAAAHRLWLVVLTLPLLSAIGSLVVTPAAYVQLRSGVIPDSIAQREAWLWTVGFGIYLGVALLLLARVGVGVNSVRKLVRASRPLSEQELLRVDVTLAEIRCDVRDADVDLPLTAGFVRPAILLPRGWRSLSASALRAILHHEAAHVRRRDCLGALGCAVLEALFWFNPAVWLATARVRWFAELACDAEAARSMEGDSYATELLGLAAGWRRARRPMLAITAGVETNVARRIRLLLDEPSRTRAVAIVGLAIALVLIVPLSSAVRFGTPPESFSVAPSFGESWLPFGHNHSHGH